MVWFEVAGWLGAALTVGAYSMRDMTRLRVVAIGANLSFITYGLATAVWPMFVLHIFLLPMNLFRLREGFRSAEIPNRNRPNGPGSRGIAVHPSCWVGGRTHHVLATRRPGRYRGAGRGRRAASGWLPWETAPQR